MRTVIDHLEIPRKALNDRLLFIVMSSEVETSLAVASEARTKRQNQFSSHYTPARRVNVAKWI